MADKWCAHIIAIDINGIIKQFFTLATTLVTQRRIQMPKGTVDNTAKITDITTKVVKLLAGLDSEGRQKVIQASMTLLGETAVDLGGGYGGNGDGTGKGAVALPGLSAKASAWIKQNGITTAEIEQVFDVNGSDVSIIAGSAPGKSDKERTIAVYVLRGLAQLLATGEPTFDDKSARKLCEDLGCYDNANHAVYMRAIGNNLAGTKDKGWKLTAPGMKKGAELLKEMTKGT